MSVTSVMLIKCQLKCLSRLWGGGRGWVVGANFYPYILQHSLLDRVSQNSLRRSCLITINISYKIKSSTKGLLVVIDC